MKKIDENELKEIFNELRNNNENAYEKLYKKYKKLVYNIAFSILKNKTDSEDIMQIVFTKIYGMEKPKLPTKNEACWIYSLTKNESISLLRKKEECFDIEEIYEIKDSNNEIDKILDKDSYNRLIMRLDDKEKQIISLKTISGLSFDEIGKLLNEPTGTIKWRYYKSVHTLKILLSNLGLFIITFLLGIKSLFSEKVKEEQSIIENESIEENIETSDDSSEIKQEMESNKELQDTIDGYNENTLKPEIVIENDNIQYEINYLGASAIGLSILFLVTTIIFSIYIIKYQLKLKHKTSK